MKGYTLIEVIISVLLLSIILIGGTTLFYQNLKAAGLSDVDFNLGNTIKSALRAMEKDIRYSEVTGVGVGTRQDCLAAADTGISGDYLEATDLNGLGLKYALTDGRISSTAAVTNKVTYLSSSEVEINSLKFTWYCLSDISDKIKIDIDASSSIMSADAKVNQSVSVEINLLNSGIN